MYVPNILRYSSYIPQKVLSENQMLSSLLPERDDCYKVEHKHTGVITKMFIKSHTNDGSSLGLLFSKLSLLKNKISSRDKMEPP